MANNNQKIKKHQARLFSTLASIEKTDRSATKRRKKSHLDSLQQSSAAVDQTKLNSTLLELRILMQRCLTEANTHVATCHVANGHGNNEVSRLDDDRMKRVNEELDALLENLLLARRDLLEHQLEAVDDSNEGEKRGDVDYAKLIRRSDNNVNDGDDCFSDTSNDDGSFSNNNNINGCDKNLAKQLDNEYTSLQTQWKSVLNKHHSNLALHSGLSVNSSKFQSKAVDVSFWEQVQGIMEHERFKQQTASAVSNDNRETEVGINFPFDDSKLYQQMLKDVISFSRVTGAMTSKTNKSGMMIDPSQEAVERLKRAMRKKSGSSTGDINLTSLLAEDDDVTAPSGGILSSNNSTKKKTTVDRKASKGRKIRYSVYPKMVNFTYPIARVEPLITEDVWFKSLFGGVGNPRCNAREK